MENTSLKTQLGTNIARLRASANVSQTSFALMVGVSRKYLIDIESGKANPTVDMLERIAGGLDSTVGQLFEGLCGVAATARRGSSFRRCRTAMLRDRAR